MPRSAPKKGPPQPAVLRLTVPPGSGGRRLDVFLSTCVPHLSRSRVQALLKDGFVAPEFPSKALKSSQMVQEGQVFLLTLPAPEASHHPAQPLDLEIVFEDKELLVVNKPVGLVVHPGAGNKDGTLLNALLAHCPDIAGVGGVKRPGLVHRLDKDTSGLMVVAKSDLAFKGLTVQLRGRKLSREYLGIVKGTLEGAGTVDAAIGRHAAARKKMAVRPETGKPARTHFRCLEAGPTASLLHLKLETGRTHQIRVHLAYIKHPILGDVVYGKGDEAAGRQMLHAFRLSLRHPKTGAPRTFFAPPPEDFLTALSNAGFQHRPWKNLVWE